MSDLNPCHGCGNEVHISAKSCPKCGAVLETIRRSEVNAWLILLLCIFLGVLGIHQFAARKVGMGFLYLFTAGLFFIGPIVDFFLIIFGKFTDKDGNYVKF